MDNRQAPSRKAEIQRELLQEGISSKDARFTIAVGTYLSELDALIFVGNPLSVRDIAKAEIY